jgi:hypothetical protein
MNIKAWQLEMAVFKGLIAAFVNVCNVVIM